MDILQKFEMVDFYRSIPGNGVDSTAVSSLSNQLKTSSGARLDWEITCRMNDISNYEEELQR